MFGFNHHRRGHRFGQGFGEGFGVRFEVGGRSRRAQRFFEHGDLRLVVLKLIAEKPRHGYELIKDIEERLGGSYAPSPGVIYPTLTLLEEMGLVSVTDAGGGKKLHTITPEGVAHLADNAANVDALFSRMDEAGSTASRGTWPPVVRAMGNVVTALRMRLMQPGVSPETVAAVAAILDEAAVKIEQS